MQKFYFILLNNFFLLLITNHLLVVSQILNTPDDIYIQFVFQCFTNSIKFLMEITNQKKSKQLQHFQ